MAIIPQQSMNRRIDMDNWQKDYRLTPDAASDSGILFVNHQANGRSGHLGHALVEYAAGKILAFYPNCSAQDARWNGHSGFGWMEYKRSADCGKTWSEPEIEPNSKALFDENCGRTMMCEKAVSPSENEIVLFYLTCDMQTDGHIWEPYFEPRCAFSHDGGMTFSQPELFVHEAGRIYDACCHDGRIYVLFFANAELPGIAHLQEHPYRLYVSEDAGKTFLLSSELPFQSTINCFYGSLVFCPDGRLIAYIYDEKDEHNPKYAVSRDGGKTWDIPRRAFLEKKIRNPQLVWFSDRCFMHGRSGSWGKDKGHFVLYSSEDGIHWDEGVYLRMATEGAGAYSNNLIVHCPDGGERLLIQASHAYQGNKTNILHWWLERRMTL